MIREDLGLTDILTGFEHALRIDYDEEDMYEIKKNTLKKLEKLYEVRLVDNIYDLQASNRLIGDNLNVLMVKIVECLKSLALLLSVTMFDKRFGQTLKDINYLGYPKHNLMLALKFLQDELLYENRQTFMDDLIVGISKIQFCPMKRLLVIMVILEDLGIKEGVALIAQYLYLGAKE